MATPLSDTIGTSSSWWRSNYLEQSLLLVNRSTLTLISKKSESYIYMLTFTPNCIPRLGILIVLNIQSHNQTVSRTYKLDNTKPLRG